ncbi:SigE family RNA polymerase sigma factor [Nocardioides sp. AE5]|uniref:SigE family RNA polymerase sigma factor n=1 Tax=Nocardioides sp. AE5 TaxID=2962573 RepID=UPI0028829897|nr:SigE family RNA polymerase sigma factor [Nocardioides sp. AE5]MDT0202010.1 SigE family RNA polymerase sigma factor [Nocardioides sp. AE5]
MGEAVMARPVADTAGDAGSGFADFVASRGDALWRSAWLLTGDSQLAEDLVQTALAKAWPKWGRVDVFEAYVRRILFTTYASWWRRRWNGELPFADLPEHPTYDVDPTTRGDLAAALAALPRGQRAVIVLRYFEDLTERQAAEVLGCSVGTVKSQTARALAALRSSSHLSLPEEER